MTFPVTTCGDDGYICRECSEAIGHCFNSIAMNSVHRKACYGCGDNRYDLDMLPKQMIDEAIMKIARASSGVSPPK